MIKYSIYTPERGIKDAGRNAKLRPGTAGASRIIGVRYTEFRGL